MIDYRKRPRDPDEGFDEDPEQWYIEVENMHGTGGYERFIPKLDGVPRVFKTRKAAEQYAYEYNIAGRSNGPLVRYVKA
jgi:hypothetical protein